jgi:hypothetical protein
MPSYVLAETVAQDYPAFLRGDVVGEEVLFSPGRLRLWVDYFSNQNGLYAVNNRIGAAAVEQWLPLGGAVVVELGGGLGSGAIAAGAPGSGGRGWRDPRISVHGTRARVPQAWRAGVAGASA